MDVHPYNKLNVANSLYFQHASIGLGYNVPFETLYMGIATNNMTSWKSGNYLTTIKYVYDQNQYPVRKEMTLPGDTNTHEIVLFEY